MKTNILDQRILQSFGTSLLARDATLLFANSPLHTDSPDRYEEDFFGRRLRPHVLKHIDFESCLTTNELTSYRALALNRVLCAMYEADFLMMPRDQSNFSPVSFAEFYKPSKLSAAAVAIPHLEALLFDFLQDEIQISSSWSLTSLRAYFTDFRDSVFNSTKNNAATAILNSSDRQTAARDWLLQLAPDFLIESSPMARYAPGSYGKVGSDLFKIIIDEYGYGDDSKRHSSLFENTLQSCGLSCHPHRYWQYYLGSSLMLSNYYNMLTRGKLNFFRYLGAIYQAETAFVSACNCWRGAVLISIEAADISYFDEHCHIDIDHSRMVFDTLIDPVVQQYGPSIIPDIVRGFEEASWLSSHAENDFGEQTLWKDSAAEHMAFHDANFRDVQRMAREGRIRLDSFVEPFGELSVTHSHDQDELCHVNSGEMEFLNGFGKSTILHAGEGIRIKRNRLHGALISSEQCDYSIYGIGSLYQ